MKGTNGTNTISKLSLTSRGSWKQIVILPIFFSIFAVQAENKATGYQINLKWEGMADSTVYLAHYFDTQIYVDDTLRLNSKGEGVFKKPKVLKQGLYMIYLNGNTYFDFLLGEDQVLKIKTKSSQAKDNIELSGAAESERFLSYQNHLFKMNQTKVRLNEELKTAVDSTRESLITEIKKIDKEMTEYIGSEEKFLPGSMYNLFIKAVAPLSLPEISADKNHPRYDSIAWYQHYLYRTDHFLDGIDFTDARILYTPLLKTKLDSYFNQVLLQIPDTISKHGLKLIWSAQSTPQMFQYMSQYVLNWGLQSKIMGMDAVFVEIARKIYLGGLATWADSTMLATINEEVFFLKDNLIGVKASPLNILTIDDEPFSLDQIKSDYTILVFWEPGCGHCKKEIPLLYEKVYMKFLAYPIEVVSVFTGAEKKEWEDFISSHELEGWHHVYDPSHNSRFRYHYNVRTTPQIYLLDKNKKIIAKRLDSENLEKLLGNIFTEK